MDKDTVLFLRAGIQNQSGLIFTLVQAIDRNARADGLNRRFSGKENLSGNASRKRSVVEILSSLNFTLEDYSLVLHPFKTNARELIHTKIGFGMELSALNLGAYL